MTEDVMRIDSRKLSQEDIATMNELKELGNKFVHICTMYGSNRELALARTNMEQAVMWASKGISA